MEKMYTPKEAAAFFRVEDTTIRLWIKEGKLLAHLAPGYNPKHPRTRRWLIPESAIKALLKG